LVEALTALLFWAIWRRYGWDVRTPMYWIVASGLVLGSFVDLDHLIIPDRVTIGGMATGLVFSTLFPRLHGADAWLHGLSRAVLGMGVGLAVLWIIAELGRLVFKKEAMGLGDVKLLGAIGAYLGWPSVVFTLVLSSFTGSIVGIALILLGGREWQSRIPYGPFLALGAIVWMLGGTHWGRPICAGSSRRRCDPLDRSDCGASAAACSKPGNTGSAIGPPLEIHSADSGGGENGRSTAL